MIIPMVIIVISLLLDGILNNIFPYMVDNLSIFTPMFTILLPIIIYPFYIKNKKKYLITLIITGIVYDIFYTNLLFYDGIVLFIFGLIMIKLYKNIGYNFIKVILYSILFIVLYELFNYIVIVIFNLVPINIDKLIYKIVHSLLLNVIYSGILYFIVKNIDIITQKHYKIRKKS